MRVQNLHTPTVTVMVMSLAPITVMAGDAYWDDASGGNFSGDTNWDTCTAPGPGDNGIIGSRRAFIASLTWRW